MARYFIELSYKGTHYNGFQVQPTGVTIQGVLEKALATFYRTAIPLTGSSRTDSGVHALQNYFHTDTEVLLLPQHVYHLNALLPRDVVVKNIIPVAETAHARFDALYRRYRYFIHFKRDPFLVETSWYYPYPLNADLLDEAAAILLLQDDFTSFSKRNTQAHTMICKLNSSEWVAKENGLEYMVSGNRFLRGMVRALVGSMLQVGRGKINLETFGNIIAAKDCRLADFSTPPHGLFLEEVAYPQNYFTAS